MAQSNDIVFTHYFKNQDPKVTNVHFDRYPKDAVLSAMAKAMIREDGGVSVDVSYPEGGHILSVTTKLPGNVWMKARNR